MKTFKIIFNVFWGLLILASGTIILLPSISESGILNIFLEIIVLSFLLCPTIIAELDLWYTLYYFIFAKNKTVGKTIFNIIMILPSLFALSLQLIPFIVNAYFIPRYFSSSHLTPLCIMVFIFHCIARISYFIIVKYEKMEQQIVNP